MRTDGNIYAQASATSNKQRQHSRVPFRPRNPLAVPIRTPSHHKSSPEASKITTRAVPAVRIYHNTSTLRLSTVTETVSVSRATYEGVESRLCLRSGPATDGSDAGDDRDELRHQAVRSCTRVLHLCQSNHGLRTDKEATGHVDVPALTGGDLCRRSAALTRHAARPGRKHRDPVGRHTHNVLISVRSLRMNDTESAFRTTRS